MVLPDTSLDTDRISPRTLSQTIKRQSYLSRKTSIAFETFASRFTSKPQSIQLQSSEPLTVSHSQPAHPTINESSPTSLSSLNIDDEEDVLDHESRRRSYSLSKNRLSRCFTEPITPPIYSSPNKRTSLWTSLEDTLLAQDSPCGAMRIREEPRSPLSEALIQAEANESESRRASQRRRSRRSTSSFRSSDLPLSAVPAPSQCSRQSLTSSDDVARCLDQSFDNTDTDSVAQSPDQSAAQSVSSSVEHTPSKTYDRILRVSRRRNITFTSELDLAQSLIRTISSPAATHRSYSMGATPQLAATSELYRCRSSTHPGDSPTTQARFAFDELDFGMRPGQFRRSMSAIPIPEASEELSPTTVGSPDESSVDFELPCAPELSMVSIHPRQSAVADQPLPLD